MTVSPDTYCVRFKAAGSNNICYKSFYQYRGDTNPWFIGPWHKLRQFKQMKKCRGHHGLINMLPTFAMMIKDSLTISIKKNH